MAAAALQAFSDLQAQFAARGAGLDPAAWNERWNERRAPRLESLWRIFQPRVIDGSGGEQTGDSIRREGNERRRRLRRW